MKRFDIKLLSAILWLGFVVALSSWWVVFTSGFIDEMMAAHLANSGDLLRRKSMVFWEGISLVGFLIAGGTLFVMLVWRESERASSLKLFFSTFNHELKTSLASLRLQAEILKEDAPSAGHAAIDRLVEESGRLELQLENSLYLGAGSKQKLFFEWIEIKRFVDRLKFYYPKLEFVVESTSPLYVDSRAMETVLRNLVQNSIVHGGARKIHIQLMKAEHGLQLAIRDNGKGYDGNSERLGRPFERLSATSGSGLGLSIVKNLVQQMGGEIHFESTKSNGFSTHILLPAGPT